MATVSRGMDPRLFEIPLFAEDGQRVLRLHRVARRAAAAARRDVRGRRGWRPATLTAAACLRRLREDGARVVVSEGGPTLLRELLAEGLVDDLVLTIAPGDRRGLRADRRPRARVRPAARAGAARGAARGGPPVPALRPGAGRGVSALPPLAVPGRTIVVESGAPLVMGIVNANPDSFSDSVRLDTLERQVEHALALVAAGADIIDVGGESGRDLHRRDARRGRGGARRAARRAARRGRASRCRSTRGSREVAQAVVDAGAAIINDVSGLADPRARGRRRRVRRGARRHAHARGAQAGALRRLRRRRRRRRRGVPARAASTSRMARGVAAEQLLVDPGPRLRQDAGRERRGAARAAAAARARAPDPPARLAQVRDRRDHRAVRRASAWPERSPRCCTAWPPARPIVRVHDVAAAVDAIAVWRVLEGRDPVPEIDGERRRPEVDPRRRRRRVAARAPAARRATVCRARVDLPLSQRARTPTDSPIPRRTPCPSSLATRCRTARSPTFTRSPPRSASTATAGCARTTSSTPSSSARAATPAAPADDEPAEERPARSRSRRGGRGRGTRRDADDRRRGRGGRRGGRRRRRRRRARRGAPRALALALAQPPLRRRRCRGARALARPRALRRP